MSKKSVNIGCNPFVLIIGIITAMVGHHIHGSIFWAIMDLIFWPFAWIKWLIMHQVNISIIKETFSFFLK